MQLDQAVRIVVADQRGQQGRTVGALKAIQHVRRTYGHETVNVRVDDGSISDRRTAHAYRDVINADGYELSMLFAAWEPAQSRRPGCSPWAIVPVIVVVLIVLAELGVL